MKTLKEAKVVFNSPTNIPINQLTIKPIPLVLLTHPMTGRLLVIWQVSFMTLQTPIMVACSSATLTLLWSGVQ